MKEEVEKEIKNVNEGDKLFKINDDININDLYTQEKEYPFKRRDSTYCGPPPTATADADLDEDASIPDDYTDSGEDYKL